MATMVALLTGSALLAGLAGFFAWLARTSAENALHSESRLLTQRGRIVSLETSLDALDAKVRKLNSRLSAEKRWDEHDARAEQFTPQRNLGLAVCENYVTAQREGPRSAAASCECAYCTAARAERERFRAQAKANGANLAALKASQ